MVTEIIETAYDEVIEELEDFDYEDFEDVKNDIMEKIDNYIVNDDSIEFGDFIDDFEIQEIVYNKLEKDFF